MKTLLVLLFMITVGADPLWAQKAGELGAGVIVGKPTGVTAKLWLYKSQALDVGAGFGRNLTLYSDYLWYIWEPFRQPAEGKLPLYLGLGAQIKNSSPEEIGVRTVAGIAYWLPHDPVEIFLELVPVFNLSHDKNVNLYLGIGSRYYFKID